MRKLKPVHDDVLNYRRLEAETPKTPLRLDYPSQPTTADHDRRLAVGFGVAIAGGVGIIATIAHIFGDRFLASAFIASFASLGFMTAIVCAITKQPLWVPLAVLFGAPFAPVLFALLHYATRPGPLLAIVGLAAIALTAWLSHLIAAHWARVIASGPAVAPARVSAWRKAWSGPWHWNAEGPTTLHGWYPLAAAVACLLLYGIAGLATEPTVALMETVSLIALAALSCIYAPFRRAWRGLGMAVGSWLSYGSIGVQAPGMLVSPAGSVTRRRVLTLCGLFLLSTWSVSRSGFWGVLVREHPAPWQAAFDQAMETRLSSTAIFAAIRNYEFEPKPKVELKPAAGEKPTDSKSREDEEKRLLAAWSARQLQRFLAVEPTAWVSIAMDGIVSGDSFFVWALLLSGLMAIVFPLLVMLVPTVTAIGFVEFVVGRDVRKHVGSTRWANLRERITQSDNPLESEHLWLGTHSYDDYPVMLHEKLLSEHVYITGDSGSGKSALGLTGLLLQLIERKNAPVIILDLKGDHDMFQATRAWAGDRFRFFTVERGRGTHTFNPFEQGTGDVLTLNQVVETILEALDLNHGSGYGRSYFARMARWFLRMLFRRRPNIATFTELFEATRGDEDGKKKKGRDEAAELIAVIESLTSFEQLNITAESRRYPQAVQDHAIHMPRAFEENQVVYFWLPSVLESASVAEIAKLLIYSVLQTGFMWRSRHGRTKQAYLVIDEFQRIASRNFKVVLEQARSFGIGTILANQSIADLKTPDVDLRATVQANTRVKMFFSASDLDQQEDIMRGSGEATDYRFSMSVGPNGTTESLAEFTRPRLQRNDVIRASDDPHQCILQVHRGSGYTQLSGFSIPVTMSFAITAEQRDGYAGLGWPDAAAGTITVARQPLVLQTDVETRIEIGKKVIEEAKATEPQKPIDFSGEIAALRTLAVEYQSSVEIARYGGPHD